MILKKFLLMLYNLLYEKMAEVRDWMVKKKIGIPRVLTIDETINYIISKKCSVARYGDGEFKIITGQDIRFQKYDENLSRNLAKTLKSNNKNLLVCISDIFNKIDWMTEEAYNYTKHIIIDNRKNWTGFLDLKKTYGNSFISRCYMDREDKSNSAKWFIRIMSIWENQDIVIIEGKQSRLGYHNDLFENAHSVQRILCPPKNAYYLYEKILTEAKKVSKDKLILIALGPTATVLASDLCDLGYWAIDIGHIDIEYEWFLKGDTKKTKVKNKYTNEAPNGEDVDDNLDKEFWDQIICIID